MNSAGIESTSLTPYMDGEGWVSALDSNRVHPTGEWRASLFRYARTTCLQTSENGAELTFTFTGTGVALGLGQHAVAAYGQPNLGKLTVTIDGKQPQVVLPPRGRSGSCACSGPRACPTRSHCDVCK